MLVNNIKLKTQITINITKKELIKIERSNRKYEEVCFISLMSAIINQTSLPKWNLSPQWQHVNTLAKDLGVQNLLYYAIIGQNLKGTWKKDVEESYKNAILNDEKYPIILESILGEFEKKHIHSMIISGFNYRRYYLKSQMRDIKEVSLLIGKDKEKVAHSILMNMGFVLVDETDKNQKSYYRLVGDMHLKLCTQIKFQSKRLKKYFAKPVTIYKLKRDKVFTHEMTAEESYVWLISKIAENFNLKQLKMNELIDLYCFYRVEEKLLDKQSVKKEIETLKLSKFNDYIMQLLEYWFGKSIFPTENDEYKALERYILTKGNQGINFARTLVSFNIKEEKTAKDKKERSQKNEWLFPELEYMKDLYPVLEKKPYLLNYFRILRFNRIVYKRVSLAVTSVVNYIKKSVKYAVRFIKKIIYNIADKFKKNNDNNT